MSELLMKNIGGKNTVAIKSVAEVFGIPDSIAYWMLKQGDGDVVRDIDYVMAWKQAWLFPSGVLWLANRSDFKDYRKLVEMIGQIENFGKDSENDAVEKLVETVDQLREVQESLKLSQEIASDLVPGITDKTKKVEDAVSEAPVFTPSEQEWADKFEDAIDAKKEELGVSRQKILRAVFDVMRNSYGVVFEQARKEWVEANMIQQGARIPTFDLVVHTPPLRSIFWGILGNVEEYLKKDTTDVEAERKGA